MSEENQIKTVNLEIQLDDATSLGQYVNMAVIQHSASEFVLDFVFVMPGQPKARVRSRLIMSPDNAKRTLKSLQDNVNHFERRFGEIKLPEPPAGAMPLSPKMQ